MRVSNLVATHHTRPLSAALNAAQNGDDIVGAIISSGLAEEPALASLSIVETDEDGRPRWSTVAASWAAPGLSGSTRGYMPGERFHLPDIDIAEAWAMGRSEPILIEDAEDDERVEGMLLALYDSMGVRATVLLPLRVRDSWVGIVEISWPEPRRFASHDRRIFRSMATQLAVTLSNQRLVEEVRARSRQLEILSRVEADLSLATIEDEILAVLAGGPPWSEPPALELFYLSPNADGTLLAQTASQARDGKIGPPANAQSQLLATHPLSALWLDNPRDLLIVESVQRDTRLNKAMRAQLEREGWRAMVVMPLRLSLIHI